MTANIQTIFFDVGNTLRIVLPDQEFIDRAEAGLMELIGTTESHDALFAKLEERWKAYRKQSKTTLLDASEGELWTQYMLPEYDPNMIFANAPKLTRLWRDHDGRRVARPDAVATIKELHRRGYTLGIIANTVTETEIPDWMAADGVAQCFKTTGNHESFQLMKDNIDFDASPALTGEKTIDQLAEELYAMLMDTADGQETKAEILGYTETAVMRACNYV